MIFRKPIKSLIVDSATNKKHTKVVIYGGNGYVGTRVAERLSLTDTCTVCLSRSGHKPLHLKDQEWSASVRWCKGDASKADEKLLSSADVLICLVGSPPVPTFSQKSYEHQVFMNGTSCVNAIQSAQRAGIKRVVLLGAQLPFPLKTDKFGYAKGKRLALEAAKAFADESDLHTAVVLQPGAIYGRRHLPNGKVLPLHWFMKPMSVIAPWQFISVNEVADCVVQASLDDQPYLGKFTVISNSAIRKNTRNKD